MTNLINCIVYLALVGILGFFLGRILPKDIFKSERFPFAPFRWERQGAVYELLGVRRWKERMPDMSVILPGMMPSKKLSGNAMPEHIELMIRETCVAEWIHGVLCVAGLGCVLIWKGVWGWVVSVVYSLFGNIPYIIIQRYNRPKLERILRKKQARETVNEECDHFELQHGTGA